MILQLTPHTDLGEQETTIYKTQISLVRKLAEIADRYRCDTPQVFILDSQTAVALIKGRKSQRYEYLIDKEPAVVNNMLSDMFNKPNDNGEYGTYIINEEMGTGTDFKTSSDIESKGGLVLVFGIKLTDTSTFEQLSCRVGRMFNKKRRLYIIQDATYTGSNKDYLKYQLKMLRQKECEEARALLSKLRPDINNSIEVSGESENDQQPESMLVDEDSEDTKMEDDPNSNTHNEITQNEPSNNVNENNEFVDAQRLEFKLLRLQKQQKQHKGKNKRQKHEEKKQPQTVEECLFCRKDFIDPHVCKREEIIIQPQLIGTNNQTLLEDSQNNIGIQPSSTNNQEANNQEDQTGAEKGKQDAVEEDKQMMVENYSNVQATKLNEENKNPVLKQYDHICTGPLQGLSEEQILLNNYAMQVEVSRQENEVYTNMKQEEHTYADIDQTTGQNMNQKRAVLKTSDTLPKKRSRNTQKTLLVEEDLPKKRGQKENDKKSSKEVTAQQNSKALDFLGLNAKVMAQEATKTVRSSGRNKKQKVEVDISKVKTQRELIDEGYFKNYSKHSIHKEMVNDKVRIEKYQKAIELACKGKQVLDLGCGSGILSAFAIKSGAEQVFAVDNADVKDIMTQKLNEMNVDFTKIKYIQGSIETLTAQEIPQVDVIVSEWMGYFLLFENMIASFIYAKKFLKADGIMIPQQANLYLNPAMYDIQKNKIGRKYQQGKCKTVKVAPCETESLLQEEPTMIKALDFTGFDFQNPLDQGFSSDFGIVVGKQGLFNAFVGSFDVELYKDVTLRTMPTYEQTHWKQSLFFIDVPIEVSKGEIIEGNIKISADQGNHRNLIVKFSYNVKGRGFKTEECFTFE